MAKKKPNPGVEPSALELLQKDYQVTFRGLSGERVLEDLMVRCGIFATPPELDSTALVRLMGRADIGKYILQMIGDVKTEKGRKSQ